MTVGELIEKLQEFDPSDEVHFCTDGHAGWTSRTTEAETVEHGRATYGSFTDHPRTVNTAVLNTLACGL